MRNRVICCFLLGNCARVYQFLHQGMIPSQLLNLAGTLLIKARVAHVRDKYVFAAESEGNNGCAHSCKLFVPAASSEDRFVGEFYGFLNRGKVDHAVRLYRVMSNHLHRYCRCRPAAPCSTHAVRDDKETGELCMNNRVCILVFLAASSYIRDNRLGKRVASCQFIRGNLWIQFCQTCLADC